MKSFNRCKILFSVTTDFDKSDKIQKASDFKESLIVICDDAGQNLSLKTCFVVAQQESSQDALFMQIGRDSGKSVEYLCTFFFIILAIWFQMQLGLPLPLLSRKIYIPYGVQRDKTLRTLN